MPPKKMSPDRRHVFNDLLDREIKKARAAFWPLLESGAELPEAEADLMYEVMFKLRKLRSVLIYGEPAQDVHGEWLAMLTERRKAAARLRRSRRVSI
jgi:hypothetical protein